MAIRYEGKDLGEVRVLEDALRVTDREGGRVVVPCREGLLIPADSGVAFKQTFGTSDYEGCHMNMLGLVKSGAALVVTWDDAYVWPEVQSVVSQGRSAARSGSDHDARAAALGPLGAPDAAGQGRLEHDRRGLPPHRRAEGPGRHAPPKRSSETPMPDCWSGPRT